MSNELIIIGASGHGKVVADIARKNNYENIVFLDDNLDVKTCGNYPVIGGCCVAVNHQDSDFIVAIGNAKIRQKIQSKLLEQGFNVVTLIHPAAVVASDVEIGIGTVIMAGAVINPCTKIGQGCIINTCSSVDHDCRIGDYVHVSVGAHTSGTVTIGDSTWIGAGATVSNNIEITSGCVIGAGAVVINDLLEKGTYVGVPARLQFFTDHQ